VLTLNASKKVTASESQAYALGPDVADRADMLEQVNGFEAARKKARAAGGSNASGTTGGH
jgi:hypothetical protein